MSLEDEVRTLREKLAQVERKAQAAEDHNAIVDLQNSYGFYVDKSQWDQVADLFARDATLEINARGRFFGQDRIRDYMHHFGPAQDGVLMNHIQLQPVVHVAPDGQTAHCRCRAMMQVGRLNGEALWGEAIYENDYVREDGVWKIATLRAYQTFYTPFDKGWNKEVLPLMTAFDDFPPDELTQEYPVFPQHFVPPFHYRNPVSGRA
ncbi:nuclear transport factor 2 family protein [Sphingomonas sp. MMS24-J13]|uniref:nuclear transport factor 2 family protein n=1 Tax=Sphingomonas sp. MMS24-J13 TaxID=3238686 RepID=UPI00384B531C